MRHLWQILVLALAVPLSLAAQRREFQEIQRDLGLLHEEVRTLQRSFDEKMAALTVLVQQALDSSTKANTAVALLEREVRERLREQERTVAAPIAGVGSKVDTLADEFRFVKESVADLSARMGRLQGQIVDLGNAVKTLQSPPAPPSGLTPGTPPAGVSPNALFNDATRDRLAGRFDLALQQYRDFLTWFPTTDLACEAQYYIGEIHHNRGELAPAEQAFDLVLEKYPSDCTKIPDAMFMKGRTLARADRKAAAVTEFQEMLKRYPTGEWASKVRAELKALGFGSAPAGSKKRR